MLKWKSKLSLKAITKYGKVLCILAIAVFIYSVSAQARICFLPGGTCPGDMKKGRSSGNITEGSATATDKDGIRASLGDQCIGYNLTKPKCKDEACEEGWYCTSCTNAQGTFYKCVKHPTPAGYTAGMYTCATSCQDYLIPDAPTEYLLEDDTSRFTGNEINGKCVAISGYSTTTPAVCTTWEKPVYRYGVSVTGATIKDLKRNDCYYNVQSLGEHFSREKDQPTSFIQEEKKDSFGEMCYRAQSCNNTNGWYDSIDSAFKTELATSITGVKCYHATACNNDNGWYSYGDLGQYNQTATDGSKRYFTTIDPKQINIGNNQTLVCYKIDTNTHGGCYATAYTSQPDSKYFASSSKKVGGTTCWIANSCAAKAYTSEDDTNHFSYSSSSAYFDTAATQTPCYNVSGCRDNYAYTDKADTTHLKYDDGVTHYQNGSETTVTCYKLTGCADNVYSSKTETSYFTYDAGKSRGKDGATLNCYHATGCADGAFTTYTTDDDYVFDFTGKDRKQNGTSTTLTCYRATSCDSTNHYTTAALSSTYFTSSDDITKSGVTCRRATGCASGYTNGWSSTDNCGTSHAAGWSYDGSSTTNYSEGGTLYCGKCDAKSCTSGQTTSVDSCGSTGSAGYTWSGASNYTGDTQCGSCSAKACPNGEWPSGTGHCYLCTPGKPYDKLGDEVLTNNYNGETRCYKLMTCAEYGGNILSSYHNVGSIPWYHVPGGYPGTGATNEVLCIDGSCKASTHSENYNAMYQLGEYTYCTLKHSQDNDPTVTSSGGYWQYCYSCPTSCEAAGLYDSSQATDCDANGYKTTSSQVKVGPTLTCYNKTENVACGCSAGGYNDNSQNRDCDANGYKRTNSTAVTFAGKTCYTTGSDTACTCSEGGYSTSSQNHDCNTSGYKITDSTSVTYGGNTCYTSGNDTACSCSDGGYVGSCTAGCSGNSTVSCKSVTYGGNACYEKTTTDCGSKTCSDGSCVATCPDGTYSSCNFGGYVTCTKIPNLPCYSAECAPETKSTTDAGLGARVCGTAFLGQTALGAKYCYACCPRTNAECNSDSSGELPYFKKDGDAYCCCPSSSSPIKQCDCCMASS